MTPKFISPGPVLSDLQTHVSNCLLGIVWIGISSRTLDFVSQTHLGFSLLHIGKECYYSPICSGQKSWSCKSLTLLFPSRAMQSNSKSFHGTFQESSWSVHSSCPSWQLLYSKPLSFLTTTVVYLICFLSCPLESILLPEIKMTFEKTGTADDFSLASNLSAFHHISRIKSKVVNLVCIDLCTAWFSSWPQPYQCLHPTHNFCSRHSEVLLLEQAKFIPASGPLPIFFPFPGNQLPAHATEFLRFSRALFRCHLIREEFFVCTIKIAHTPELTPNVHEPNHSLSPPLPWFTLAHSTHCVFKIYVSVFLTRLQAPGRQTVVLFATVSPMPCMGLFLAELDKHLLN